MKKLISISIPLVFMVICNIQGVSLAEATKSGSNSKQTVANKQGLTELLMQQLNVTKAQAEGGAGAIFQLAKTKMAPGAFTRLSSTVPGMQGFLAAAPTGKLPATFQKLGLAPDMEQKFVPVIMKYVHGVSGEAIGSVLQAALMGGF